MSRSRVVVVGAGIGGLTAAVELARAGLDVELVERAPRPGGKMREVTVGDARIESGPTVLTMRWVFDALFERAGTSLDEVLTLSPLGVIARHAWSADERLDLYADVDRSADAIGDFAGAAEARRYRAFCDHAERVFDVLDRPFIRSDRPSPIGLTLRTGPKGAWSLARARPFASLWHVLGDYFHDARLRQLFGRYATYVGSTPFEAPATLALIAHVERVGVWVVEGGLSRLADALAALARAQGVRLRLGSEVDELLIEHGRIRGVRLASGEELEASTVVSNADVAALAAGRFGAGAAGAIPPRARSSRSLSAVTWACRAQTSGFPLHHHNVFFSRDYESEFQQIVRDGRLPDDPTVYVCAQDRGSSGGAREAPVGPERMLCLVNAPAVGDDPGLTHAEIDQCEKRTLERLRRCGLDVDWAASPKIVTTPADFEALFPATGGALYGEACRGWRAPFRRPGPRTRLAGLYVVGGSTHPGPGVPMTALSGLRAAEAVLRDLRSTGRPFRAAISGGTSTR